MGKKGKGRKEGKVSRYKKVMGSERRDEKGDEVKKGSDGK